MSTNKTSAKRQPVRLESAPNAKSAAKSAAKSTAKSAGEQAASDEPNRLSAIDPHKLESLPSEHELEEFATEEIWELYHKVVGGPETGRDARVEHLRNALMKRHLPLVRYIAERLLTTLPKSIELDDLVSAGLFGLMDAIRGFDPERGIKFKTYCTTRIRGSILDQLRSQDWVPRLVRLKATRIDKAYQALTGTLGREPTHAELAKVLEMEHGELSKEISEASAKTMFSLSEKWEDHDDDGGTEKVDILEDHGSVDPLNELNRRDLLHFVTRSLTHKERFIIEQYYRVGHTMREIGEMLALTESRVCQIHSNVMGRLKNLLGQKQGSLLM